MTPDIENVPSPLPPRRRSRGIAGTAIVALLVVAVDVLSKYVVQQRLDLGDRREVLPGLLVLTHIRNTGAAYGLLAGQRWLLVLSAAVIAVAAPLMLQALPLSRRWAWLRPTLTGMILGGAAGNLIERARHGWVTDFLNVPPVPLFQVFNLSDAAISVAIVVLLVLSLFGGEAEAPPAPAHAGSEVAMPARADERPHTGT